MERKTDDTAVEEVLASGEGEQRTFPFAGIALAFVFAAAAFFSGMQIGSDVKLEANIGSLFAQTPEKNVDLARFWSVWDMLDERFVTSSSTDPLTAEERLDGAIKGLVDSYGDPYTVYLPAEESAKFEEEIAGNFEGVGMEVGSRDDVLTVIAPLPNTPAERAGIKSGDAIVRIDGTSTEGMSIDEAVKLIRGEKGTEVAITIYREGEEEFREIKVVRDRIDIPTIDTEIRGDVFIISLFNFSAMSEARFQEALREYVVSGKRKLILDLRGNPGGFLQSAVNISSFFLPTGKVIVRENFGGAEEERLFRSSGRTLREYTPEKMVVLVDGGSASASEIVAGALQEHGVATLIGAKTFGKGSVQELVSLDGGSSLKITIARWLTPNGNSISEGGLTPDIEVELEDDGEGEEVDEQLEAALDFLKR